MAARNSTRLSIVSQHDLLCLSGWGADVREISGSAVTLVMASVKDEITSHEPLLEWLSKLSISQWIQRCYQVKVLEELWASGWTPEWYNFWYNKALIALWWIYKVSVMSKRTETSVLRFHNLQRWKVAVKSSSHAPPGSPPAGAGERPVRHLCRRMKKKMADSPGAVRVTRTVVSKLRPVLVQAVTDLCRGRAPWAC